MKNEKILAIIAISVSSLFAFIKTIEHKWNLDIKNSKIGFTVKHLDTGDISGYFEEASCSLVSSSADLQDAKVIMKAKAKSVKTNDASLDKEIKGADFFDVKKYPEISFESTSFKKTDKENEYLIEGNLKLKDKIQLIQLHALLKPGEKPVLSIQGSLFRNHFDMGKDVPESVLANEISLLANAEFVKQ